MNANEHKIKNIIDRVSDIYTQILELVSERESKLQEVLKDNIDYIEEYFELCGRGYAIPLLSEKVDISIDDEYLILSWGGYLGDTFDYGTTEVPLEFLTSEDFRREEKERLTYSNKAKTKEKLERELRELKIKEATILVALENINEMQND